MEELLKGECPHCGQSVEYPPEGTGQTVPCPTCEEPFVLRPVEEPAPASTSTPAASSMAAMPLPPPPGVQQRPATLSPPKPPPPHPLPAAPAAPPKSRPEALTLHPPTPLTKPPLTPPVPQRPTPPLPSPSEIQQGSLTLPSGDSPTSQSEKLPVAPTPAALPTLSRPRADALSLRTPAPPAKPSPPQVTSVPPLPSPPPKAVPATTAQNMPPKPAATPKKSPLEQAYAAFENDRAFAGHAPTREQVARAWSSARFKKEDENELPTHPEVVVALKKLFPEFRSSQSTIIRSR